MKEPMLNGGEREASLPPDFYCPTCGSCGITDCCGLRCLFLDQHREDYREMEQDAEEQYRRVARLEAALREIADMPAVTPARDVAAMRKIARAALHEAPDAREEPNG